MSPARFSVPQAGKSPAVITGCRVRRGSPRAPSLARARPPRFTLSCRGRSWREGGIEG